MIRPNPIWRSVAILGVAGLVVTACGDDGDTATPKSSDSTSSQPAAKGDGELVVGTLLPQTGSLAFLGPPEFAGVDLAVKKINDAGGVLGKPVKVIDSDSGDTTTNTASTSVDRLLSTNVDAIVGAASSSVSLSVIDKIVGSGVLQISPANTSDTLTTYDDKGLYWRTAPPDLFQGRVLGDLALADGNSTMGILALQDAYGTGLAEKTEASLPLVAARSSRRSSTTRRRQASPPRSARSRPPTPRRSRSSRSTRSSRSSRSSSSRASGRPTRRSTWSTVT